MRNLKINKHLVGDGHPCLVVAEAGVNHQGSLAKAKELIDIAAKAGADVVKFQYHLPDSEMILHPAIDRLNESVRKTQLSLDDLIKLMVYATAKSLIPLITPFSLRAAMELLPYVTVLKIGSGEITNIPFLKSVVESFSLGQTIILSTGMSTFSEIEAAVQTISGLPHALMVCSSQYPAYAYDFDLNRIALLKEKFQCPVGISDHCIENHISFAAVAMGANIVEKHFTTSRKSEGDDHHMSLEPDELKDLVQGIRNIEQAIKPKPWILSRDDLEMRLKYNHSVVSAKDIPKDKTIDNQDIWPKRPGLGIPAIYLDMVVGKKAKREIKKDSLVSWEDLEIRL